MAAKESEPEATKSETVVQQPVAVAPVVVQTEKPKNNQSALTIAIISAVALFFVGLGLGYLLGHSTNERSRIPLNGIRLPGDRERRFYSNSGTDTSTNSTNGNTNTNTQTN